MGDTEIEWADKVWNPVTGCTKISEDGKPHFSVRVHPERLEEPLKWKKPQRIFVCSMGDLFHEDVQWNWLDGMFSTMYHAPQHTYLILTKRPQAAFDYFNSPRISGSVRKTNEFLTDNLWLGVTVENQQAADERIPILLQIPAVKRFISIEPMLSEIKFSADFQLLDLCIVGGETGPKARPMHPDWARSVRDQCQAAGVPFFFKQMSKKEPIPEDLTIREWPKA